MIKAASVLRVAGLKAWINNSYASSYLRKGLDALKGVCLTLLNRNEEPEILSQNSDSSTEANSQDNFTHARLFNCSQNDSFSHISKESLNYAYEKALDNEIILFSKLIGDSKIIKNAKSTAAFWSENKDDLPKLFELQIILLNIPATSSFIERFFSICGIVCDARRLNMEDDLIEMRSMMKTNMWILTELKNGSKSK